MSTKGIGPLSQRGALSRAVAEVLAAEPDREFRFEEVAAKLDHNVGSVASALSDAHRNSSSPITRIAPGTYTWCVADIPEALTDGVDFAIELGTCFEVVGLLRGQVILIDDHNHGLWVVSPVLLPFNRT